MDINEPLEEKHLKIYEVGYLIVPEIAEADITVHVESLKSTLKKFESSIITEDAPILRDLAYEMTKHVHGDKPRKFTSGYFGSIKFECSPNALPLIKDEFDKNHDLIRFILIETAKENPITLRPRSPSSDSNPADSGSQPSPRDNGSKIEVPVNSQELDKAIDNLVA